MAQSYLLYQSALNQSALTVNKPTIHIPFKEKFNLGKFSAVADLNHALRVTQFCIRMMLTRFYRAEKALQQASYDEVPQQAGTDH